MKVETGRSLNLWVPQAMKETTLKSWRISKDHLGTKLFKLKHFETLNPVYLFLFNSYFWTPITSRILESSNWPINTESIVKHRMTRLKFFFRDPHHTMQASRSSCWKFQQSQQKTTKPVTYPKIQSRAVSQRLWCARFKPKQHGHSLKKIDRYHVDVRPSADMMDQVWRHLSAGFIKLGPWMWWASQCSKYRFCKTDQSCCESNRNNCSTVMLWQNDPYDCHFLPRWLIKLTKVGEGVMTTTGQKGNCRVWDKRRCQALPEVKKEKKKKEDILQWSSGDREMMC